MNSNENPQDITETDVEGHGAYSNRIEGTDDTEGHGMRGNFAEEADDVEGHAISSGRFQPNEDEMFGQDVQGHGFTGRGLVKDEDGDHVEGHAIRAGGLVKDDDTEGHGMRGSLAEDDDTEGHGMRGSLAEDDDTEGHGMRGSFAEEADDVEGHAISSGRFQPNEDEMLGQDVQGHGLSARGLVKDEDGDDVEGHGSLRGSSWRTRTATTPRATAPSAAADRPSAVPGDDRSSGRVHAPRAG